MKKEDSSSSSLTQTPRPTPESQDDFLVQAVLVDEAVLDEEPEVPASVDSVMAPPGQENQSPGPADKGLQTATSDASEADPKAFMAAGLPSVTITEEAPVTETKTGLPAVDGHQLTDSSPGCPAPTLVSSLPDYMSSSAVTVLAGQAPGWPSTAGPATTTLPGPSGPEPPEAFTGEAGAEGEPGRSASEPPEALSATTEAAEAEGEPGPSAPGTDPADGGRSELANDPSAETIVEDFSDKAGDDPRLLKRFRPALSSIWYMFFGLLLGPAIIYFERDPQGNQMIWSLLSLLFLGLIIHRVSLKYFLSPDYIKIESWWGLGREEKLPLAELSEVRTMQGFVGRMAGTGQLDLRSDSPDEPGLIILGQKNFVALALELEDLAVQARARKKQHGLS